MVCTPTVMNKIAGAARLGFAALILIAAKAANAQGPLPITITETGLVTAYSNPNIPKGSPSPVTIGEAYSITMVIDPTTIAPMSCSAPCYGAGGAQATLTITLGSSSYSETINGVQITMGAQSGTGYAGIQIIDGATSSITAATSPVPDPLAYVNQVIAYTSNVTGTFLTNNWPASVPILYGATLRGSIQTLSIQATRTITVFNTSCADSSCNLATYSESATITFPYTVPLDGSTFYGPAKLNISIEGAQANAVIPGYNAFAYKATTLLNGVKTYDLQLVAPASVGLINVAGGYPTGIPLSPQPGLNSADFLFATIGETHFFETFGTYAKPTGFDVENVVFTLAPVAALPTVTFLDPICPMACSLLNGPQITSDLNRLSTGGVAVKGLAADGVTKVVLKAPTFNAGDKVTATLFNTECTDSSTNPSTCPATSAASAPDDGVLLPVGSSTDTTTAARFVGYEAPIDFVRTSSVAADSLRTSRTVYIRLNYSTAAGTSYGSQIVQIQLVRPPVVLVHGLWATAQDWNTNNDDNDLREVGYGLYTDGHFDVTASDYGSRTLQIYNAAPDGGSFVAKGSGLGVDFGASIVAADANDFIAKFKTINGNRLHQPVAAVQADFVAHSMGALVTRRLQYIGGFKSSENYNMGYIHKVISIAGPHLGSPVALHLPLSSNVCVRRAVKLGGFQTITTYGLSANDCLVSSDPTCQSGAIGDLAGAGDGTMLSVALQDLVKGGGLSIAYISGEMSAQELAALSGTEQVNPGPPSGLFMYSFGDNTYTRKQTLLDFMKGLAEPLPFLLLTAPLAAILTADCPAPELADYLYTNKFPSLMGGQDSDGMVPLWSQRNEPNGRINPFYDLTLLNSNGFVHSGGSATLGFGYLTTNSSAAWPPERISTMLDQTAETAVVNLLNTPVTNSLFVPNQ